jgi:vesicle coat complex subunit
VPALISSTTNENIWIRIGAIQAINFMHGAESAIPSLLACLSDSDPSVRFTAAVALGDMAKQPGTVVPKLLILLDDSDSSVRQAGAIALGLYGADAQVASGKLTELQNDPSADVRLAASAALNKIAEGQLEE